MNMSKIILLGYMFLILIVSLILGESLVSIDNLSQDKIHYFIEYRVKKMISQTKVMKIQSKGFQLILLLNNLKI